MSVFRSIRIISWGIYFKLKTDEGKLLEFDQDTTDFYGWTIPKEDIMLVGAALPPKKNFVPHFEESKQDLARQELRLGRTIARQGAVINRPLSTKQLYTGAGGRAAG